MPVKISYWDISIDFYFGYVTQHKIYCTFKRYVFIISILHPLCCVSINVKNLKSDHKILNTENDVIKLKMYIFRNFWHVHAYKIKLLWKICRFPIWNRCIVTKFCLKHMSVSVGNLEDLAVKAVKVSKLKY